MCFQLPVEVETLADGDPGTAFFVCCECLLLPAVTDRTHEQGPDRRGGWTGERLGDAELPPFR